MPLSQVRAGMDCTGYTVIHGTAISSFSVHIDGVVRKTGEGPRIMITVSGPAVAASGVAEGFSGSPVYCDSSTGTPENIGGISEGVGQYGNTVALVTPIQLMLGEPVRPPWGTPKLEERTRSLAGPLTVSGISPVLMSLLERAGRRTGREVVAGMAGRARRFASQPLDPGAAVGAAYSDGFINVGAVGTVTYRAGNTVYLFGHPLDGAGRRALLLENAFVYGVIDDPDPLLGGSYKLAVPGHVLGTVTSDTPNAVIGAVGAPPGQIPVTVTGQDLDTKHTIRERTYVADESHVGYPLGGSLLDLIAPLAVGQAGIDVYNGPPAAESGTMCVHLVLREHDTVLHFCNRYVGVGGAGNAGFVPPEVANGAVTDMGNALNLLDSVQFANLHVARVNVTLRASRGLAEASIISAHAPARVHPGERVMVQLKLRRYRSSVENVAVPLTIPRGPRGPLTVDIAGPFFPPPSLSSEVTGLISIFSEGLGGPGEFNPNPPTSLAQLGARFADIPAYDGLTTRIDHGKPQHFYRDPSLLITGRASLKFFVR